jgi:hypothetical protein
VWEKGNISIVQLEEKLRGAARQALADAIMELQLLPASLCTENTPPGMQVKIPPPLPPRSRECHKSRQEIVQVRVQKWGALEIRIHSYSSPFLCIIKVKHWQKCTHAAGHHLGREIASGSYLTNTCTHTLSAAYTH